MTSAPAIKTIGVVGAGQMGNGIAHVCALSGYDVILNDREEGFLDKGMSMIKANLVRQANRGHIKNDQVEETLSRIKTTTSFKPFEKADLAIESVVEKEEIKRQIFASICEVVPPHTLLASNTSSISITRLAATTDRPEKFIGVHFMNPVPVMKLVELIRGLATSQETYETTMHVVETLGKTIANAEDFPAFIVNRILVPMINEAVYTLYEGVGSVEAIDKAMRLGANHPMGPLELADFIGLDTCLSIMQVLNEGLADSKYRPCPLLTKYVEAGWLGRKTQRGFYDYRGEHPMPTR
ncbi:MAG: 3-hydroxybutyryl-CoA dehydrogenase [Caulobacterales bacterium]